MLEQVAVYERDHAAGLLTEFEDDDEDWSISLAFSTERHTEKIEGLGNVTQTWRLKDRVCLLLGSFLYS